MRLSRQPGGVGEGSNEDILRAVREQEEAARRVAEDNHRRAQLRTALSSIQPPLVWLGPLALLGPLCVLDRQ